MFAFIDGKKTYIAGIGLICTGIAMIASALTPEAPATIDPNKIYEGLMSIAAGLGMMGFRSAMAKGGAKKISNESN